MTGLDRWQKYRTILMSGNAVGPALLVRRAIRGAGLGRDRSVVPLHGRRMYPDGDVGRMGFYGIHPPTFIQMYKYQLGTEHRF
jgi:hypothetical protein